MRRTLTVLTLAATAAACSALAANAAVRSQHRLQGSATLALIRQTGSPPADGTQVTAGPLRLSSDAPQGTRLELGNGAVVAHVRFHAGAFAGGAVLYQPGGSISFRTAGNVSLSGQTVTFHGHGPITGGSGRYGHASGTISFTGGGQLTASTDHYTITGELALPAH